MTIRERDTAVVAGINDPLHCVRGWHERTVDGGTGIPHRPTSAEAELRLRQHPDATKLWLLLSAPVGVAGHALETTLRINESDGIPVRFLRDTWQLVPVPLVPGAGELCVRFHCAAPLVPDRVLHNGDGRALGCYFAAAWQE